MWREHLVTKEPMTLLSNKLSSAINQLTAELAGSELWLDLELRRLVLSEALPKLLQDRVGLDTLLERIPEAYLEAMFSSNVASTFVYEHGIRASSMQFFSFMQQRLKRK